MLDDENRHCRRLHSSTTMTSTCLRTRVNSLQDAYRRRHALRIVPRGPQSKSA
jgi:hypothetical protein